MYTLTPPTVEPVTLDEAKLAARVDGAQWDDIITPAIASARQLAEQHTGRRFMSQVLRFELAHLALGAQAFQLAVHDQGHAGGIVAAVFQRLQPGDEGGHDIASGHGGNDSTHGSILTEAAILAAGV